ncbi:glycosyltransferase family 4 protein [Streptomyces xinghaiensis]|uniref:glycosyltransferase family 4 protein n=1 Tax=Streptomyces xinghaiensis TaxID=1038928 RepID=UPI00343E3930
MTAPTGRAPDVRHRHGVPPPAPTARALRIVLASYACDPSRGTEPGMGWAWAEALARRGHTVELLTRPHGGNTEHIGRRIEALGPVGRRIRTHVVPAPPRPWWVRLLPGFLRAQALEFVHYDGWQRRTLEHARGHGLGRADLVHHVSYGSLVGGSALRRLGPPLVFGPVGGGQTAPRSHRRWLGPAYVQEMVRELLWVRGMSLRPTCRATVREAALVLTTNRDTARRARRLGRADPRLVLSDGVPDALPRKPAREGPERPDRPPTVLWVGRLTAIKAPELALRAFALLSARVPGARFVVLGDGPLRADLERLTVRLGLTGSVSFRGRLPWKDTLAAYDDADVLLFTSLRDSFGVQNLEAWARGLPVVHLDHQGVGDFSAPGCAAPVPLGDPADLPGRLADALAGVLADEEARRRTAEAGPRWARQHTWAAKAEFAERLYEAVLNRR